MSKFGLAFLAIFFGGIYLALVNNGAIAFVVYELIYFANPGAKTAVRWWTQGLPGLRYSMLVVLVMMFLLFRRYKEYSAFSPWKDIPAFKWMLILLAMYYLAYTFALNTTVHHKFTFEYTKLVIIILVAYKLLDSKKMLDAAVWTYAVGCAYVGILAVSKGRSGGRVEGIGMIDTPDSNGTAAVLVPAACLMMFYAWQGGKKQRIAAGILGALIANGLVLINSRGAFLGVVVSLGVFLMYMIFSRFQAKGQRGMAILIIIVGLSGALYITDDVFWERMGTLKEQDIEDTSSSGAGRVQFWLTTFDMLEDHPMGMGIYGYNMLAPFYMDDSTRGGVERRSVHSTWFQGLSEVGWIGFGIFLLMLFSLVRQAKKAKLYLIAQSDFKNYFRILSIECAFLGYLCSCTFINLFRSEIMYWMILFLAATINLYYLQAIKNVESDSAKD